jgi:hypothetical protein
MSIGLGYYYFLLLVFIGNNWFSRVVQVDAFLLRTCSLSSTHESSRQHSTTSTSTSTSTTTRSMTSTHNLQEDDGDEKSPASFRLGYVTDVEGNLEYFLKYVERSNVLDLVSNYKEDDDGGTSSSCAQKSSITLSLRHENCYFVYGGDAVDKGPGDIRLVRALVRLKRQHPDRVVLLVGNRDLNKLRFAAELSQDDMARTIDEIPAPHWDIKAPSLKEYLLERLLVLQASESTDQNQNLTTITVDQLNTRVSRLQYMLEHTLGCPKTFDFRRQELSILEDCPEDAISDTDVLESFVYEVESPNGSLRQYLEHAQVAVCIGNTLFCHGAVDRQTMQFVPSNTTKFENPTSPPPPAALIDNVQQWTDALNNFLEQGLAEFQRRPNWNADRTSRGGEALLALQNRPAMWGRSIVCNCYGDGGCITTDHAAAIRTDPKRVGMEATNPLVFENVSSDPMDPLVADWLRKDGIQRVVVGHKPTGDCPAVLSALYTGVEIVSADTSFSDTQAEDNRGAAIGIVEIVGKSSTDNHLELSGTLQDGSDYISKHVHLHPGGITSTSTTRSTDVSAGDPNLGRQTSCGWWIKAKSIDKDEYHLTKGQGRKVEHKKLAKVNAAAAIL